MMLSPEQFNQIVSLSELASSGCGLSHSLYVQRFSKLFDEAFHAVEPAVRDAAVAVARSYDYATPEELTCGQSERLQNGDCIHGLNAQTCPCGCFEY